MRTRIAFLAVLGAALSLSWWSFYSLTVTTLGLPKLFGYVVSIAFDGGAIVAGDISHKYAKTLDSGIGARLATMAFIGLSACINGMHAQLMFPGWSLKSEVVTLMFASISLIAGIGFELEMRFTNRETRRKLGRVPEAMPVFGVLTWVIHRRKPFRAIKAVTEARMNAIVRRELEKCGPESIGRELGTSGTFWGHLELSNGSSGTHRTVSDQQERNGAEAPEVSWSTDRNESEAPKDALSTDRNESEATEVAGSTDRNESEAPEDIRSTDRNESETSECVAFQSTECVCDHRNNLSRISLQSDAALYAIKIVGMDALIHNGNVGIEWLKLHGRSIGKTVFYTALKEVRDSEASIPRLQLVSGLKKYNGELYNELYTQHKARTFVATQFQCEMCGNPASVWDHCHEHGYVCGPLCTSCNLSEGRSEHRAKMWEMHRSACPECGTLYELKYSSTE